jgi:tRNA modification GTPase
MGKSGKILARVLRLMALPPLNDTITAIATAPGAAAVGIVRLSGPDSYRISGEIFSPQAKHSIMNLPAGRVIFGHIFDAGEVIDEALLLSFRKPHSYTAQDVIELQTHGGPAVLRRVLELCLKHGARPAQPGEFTLRAYLNGRLDLVQAESVLNLVNAQADSARRSAALGLTKALSEQLDLIQTDITQIYSDIQAMFDYPDEGVPEAQFVLPLERAISRIDNLLQTAQAGQLAQRGAKLALIGRPNVGKSSLLNTLLGYQRSIVSSLPGTTRDYLETPLTLGGIPITAIDTAGIRDTRDQIEAQGVAMAREIAQNADLTLYLLDSGEPPHAEDKAMLNMLEPDRSLLVLSKCDLRPAWKTRELSLELWPVSALTGEGLETLKMAIQEKLVGKASGELWISSERHAQALKTTKELLLQAKHAPDDLAALDLEEALRNLAQITGRGEIAEETLEHIFAKFCVGK